MLEGHLASRDFKEVEDSADPGLEGDFEDSGMQEDSVNFVHLDVLEVPGLEDLCDLPFLLYIFNIVSFIY